MAREERSHVKKRRRGCMGGCLTKIVLLLGLGAVLFVGACVLGFVKNDPETGAPSLSLEGVKGLESLPKIPQIDLPDIAENLQSIRLPDMSGAAGGFSLPLWPYGIKGDGLTVKTLRVGDGEAILVCADGYTMLLGGGSGMGAGICAQLLLCGVKHLNAAVAMSSEQAQIGGLPLTIALMPPQYLIFQDSQTKGAAYNRLISTAQARSRIQMLSPSQGLSFMLGRAQVTIAGPARTAHTDERDDGLSVRIDYGQTSVMIMGPITAAGERELITSRVNLRADALICARGGSEEATSTQLVEAVSPRIALMTGKDPANSVRVRLARAGAQVYTAAEHGVMTICSDGTTIQIKE